jgi:hypothetical protein
MKFDSLCNIFNNISSQDIIKALIFGIIVLIFLYFWNFKGRKRRNFIDNGIVGFANIIHVEKTLIETGSGGYARPVMRIVLEIDEVGKRQVTIKQSFDPSDLAQMGERVGILIDPKNPDKVMIYPDHQK